MKNKPLTLSIVVPAYNEAEYLGRCLDAIASQTVRPDEVIVVDNNSSDNTSKVAKKYPFVRLISEKNQGLYFSRNRGINEANGDIIGRIDADTILSKDWVKEVRRIFEDSAVQAATGPLSYYDMPLLPIGKWLDDNSRIVAKKTGYDFLAGANMAITKQAWNKIQHDLCNDPKVFEDIDIVQHLHQHGIRPSYDSKMAAAMSSRRWEDKPVDYLHYINGHRRTHAKHDSITPIGAHFVQGLLITGYVMFKPLHMTYDPEKRRPSLAYARAQRQARPDPMSVI